MYHIPLYESAASKVLVTVNVGKNRSSSNNNNNNKKTKKISTSSHYKDPKYDKTTAIASDKTVDVLIDEVMKGLDDEDES
jgi:hypothetical protein